MGGTNRLKKPEKGPRKPFDPKVDPNVNVKRKIGHPI
jgi:hypothetical protein